MKHFIVALFSFCFSNQIFAQGIQLDTSFVSAGKVSTQVNPYSGDEAWSIALQSDGKIIVGGYSGFMSFPSQAAVVRYFPDGKVDSSFGVNGASVFSPG